MANADSAAPKKHISVFYFQLLPKATRYEKESKSKKVSSSILRSTLIKEMWEKGNRKQKEEQKTLFKKRRKAREDKKEVKKFELSFCRPKSIKSRPNSPVASTSKVL
ncbi:hypothetical protein TNCV_4081751 [Trichonephila clavipes]|nr:hypothetical protein TNCV_4081751 [Trichonephila clavipes]